MQYANTKFNYLNKSEFLPSLRNVFKHNTSDFIINKDGVTIINDDVDFFCYTVIPMRRFALVYMTLCSIKVV